jgi:arylsulfatase A-like enzyme
VRQGIELDGLVTLEDVAPTLAYALGVDAPPTWQGRVIREVFVGE